MQQGRRGDGQVRATDRTAARATHVDLTQRRSSSAPRPARDARAGFVQREAGLVTAPGTVPGSSDDDCGPRARGPTRSGFRIRFPHSPGSRVTALTVTMGTVPRRLSALNEASRGQRSCRAHRGRLSGDVVSQLGGKEDRPFGAAVAGACCSHVVATVQHLMQRPVQQGGQARRHRSATDQTGSARLPRRIP